MHRHDHLGLRWNIFAVGACQPCHKRRVHDTGPPRCEATPAVHATAFTPYPAQSLSPSGAVAQLEEVNLLIFDEVRPAQVATHSSPTCCTVLRTLFACSKFKPFCLCLNHYRCFLFDVMVGAPIYERHM